MSARPGKPTLSPRRRRLRRTLLALGILAISGGALAWWWSLRSRPAPYNPNETSSDITSSLVRNLPPDAPQPRLVDVTRDAGLSDFRNFVGARTSQLPEDMGPGLAWGDFDNDGDDDLCLVGAGGGLRMKNSDLAPTVLYENLGTGAFRPVAAFPDIRVRGLGVAWGDYDGDGYLDLALAGYDCLRLYRNDAGSGRFELDPRIPSPPGFWSGVAWGDFDRDRRLDLYVTHYVRYDATVTDEDRASEQIGTAVPYTLNPAAFEPGTNALFHQNEDGTFTDVARELAVQNPAGRSLGAVWHDFDQDGWLDLYVANDVSDNVFFRNTGGRFEDISHQAWVADYRSAMGLAVGDFDRDGDDDLHVTHWVAQENALYENMLADLNGWRATQGRVGPRASSPPRPTPSQATGDKIPPRTSLSFVDIADQKGLGQIALPYVGWGTEFVDLDQDGWLDLLVANGSTLEQRGPPPRHLQSQETFLFWNRRGEHFHNLSPLSPGLSEAHVSRGLAVADYDGDGDLDVAISDLGEGVRLYRNDMSSGHWLQLRLRSADAQGRPRGFGDGSTVVAWLGDTPLRRSVTGVSYLSQSTRVLHWGLGTNTVVNRLEVRWFGGITNVVTAVSADARYEWSEGRPAPIAVGPGPSASIAPAGSPSGGATPTQANAPLAGKQRTIEFWSKHRSAMNAMKVERDNRKAIGLFREALALDPAHEDARYALAQCLAAEGDPEGALENLAELQRVDPQSHRAWQQWGALRAKHARAQGDLEAAEQALETAHRLNPEETGALQILGEIALLRGDFIRSAERLAAVAQTNPKAPGPHFLLGYLAWRNGEEAKAREYLDRSRQALGPDWQPRGATSEGDVLRKQHVEGTPLAQHWETWDGHTEPASAYRTLADTLSRSPR